ncbi:MAG: hypothetical protein KIT77_12210 [Caldilinea sp.]|nr:hypothetical protein [Caldilinea sp.]
MKADFSRMTFDEQKHYSSVLYQQGRVLTDADFNEAQAIHQHRDTTTARAVIGPAGTPKYDEIDGQPLPNGGFELAIDANGDLAIGPGHYYVDGILCENEAAVAYSQQPSLPEPEPILASLEAAGAAVGLVYFDVFEREQTALDRPELREGVLGGPDTTARAEVVWQVKVLPVPSIALADAAMAGLSARVDAVRDLRQMLAKAETEDERRSLRRDLRTAVRALAADAAAAGIACDLSPAEWDALTAPRAPQMAVDTPPVSPDDGPCAAPPDADFLGPENQFYRVEVHSTGAGGSRATSRIKWSRENGSVVAKIERVGAATSGVVSGNVLGVHSTGRDSYLGFHNGDWVEYIDDVLELNGGAGELVQIAADPENNEITLSAAVTVRFAHHPKLRRWDQGATTATRNGGTGSVANDVSGVPMNTADDAWLLLEHNIWVSFADAVYRPGDYWMLAARAATGTVEFPAGLQPADGVAHHYARLGFVMLDAAGQLQVVLDCRPLFPPLTDLRAEDVTFDNTLCQMPDTQTVQDALEQLCQRPTGGGPSPCVVVGVEGAESLEKVIDRLLESGATTLCLCLMPGEHVISDRIWDMSGSRRAIHLTIKGCGPESRIVIQERMTFIGWAAVTLRDVAVEYVAGVRPEMGLRFVRCRDVTVEGCSFEGATIGGALLLLSDVDRALVAASQFDAVIQGGYTPIRELLAKVGGPFGAVGEVLDAQIAGRIYGERSAEVGEELAKLSAAQRQKLNKQLQSVSSDQALGDEVRFAFTKVSLVLAAKTPQAADLTATLLDLRRAALRFRPGVALLLENGTLTRVGQEFPEIGQIARFDVDDQIILRGNRMDGLLALYAPPMNPDEELKFLGSLSQLLEVRDKLFLIELAGNTLQLVDNRLLKVTMPQVLWEQLLKIAQGGATDSVLQILFRELIVQGNVIAEDRNAFVAGRITMANNIFAKSPRDDLGILGVAIAHSAVYTGNQGQGDENARLTVRHLARFPRDIRPYAAINHGFTLT